VREQHYDVERCHLWVRSASSSASPLSLSDHQTNRPTDTPFEDGTFKLTLTFQEDYPNKPPAVRFVSKMFHPNVYADGQLCLDILQNRWSPTYDVAAILTSIQVCLCKSFA